MGLCLSAGTHLVFVNTLHLPAKNRCCTKTEAPAVQGNYSEEPIQNEKIHDIRKKVQTSTLGDCSLATCTSEHRGV